MSARMTEHIITGQQLQRVVDALTSTASMLNSARLIMSDEVSRELAGNAVASARAILASLRSMRADAALTAELDQLRLEVWRQGSRFNCVVLDKPPLPDRGFYRSNAEFLKACAEAVDAFMANSSAQGRATQSLSSGSNASRAPTDQ